MEAHPDIIKLESFINRLKRIGIDVELFGNYPWVYLDKVNGKKITSKYYAEHGFTIFFRSARHDGTGNFTNLSIIFNEIRQSLKEINNEGQSNSNSN